MIRSLALMYLRWRCGGNVYGLQPPLGYHRIYAPRPIWWIAFYRIKRVRYELESQLFERHGQPMREAWLNSFT